LTKTPIVRNNRLVFYVMVESTEALGRVVQYFVGDLGRFDLLNLSVENLSLIR